MNLGGKLAADTTGKMENRPHRIKPWIKVWLARMAAHIIYLSKKAPRKFEESSERDDLKFGFDADFQIESYLVSCFC